MEPVNEVYVVLSGKDLVYVTMNLPDAEGLQYRLTEAGVDAAVGPAVLVTKERHAELGGRARELEEKLIYLGERESFLEGQLNHRNAKIEGQESNIKQYIRRIGQLSESLDDCKSFAAYLNKETQRLRVELEESEKEVKKLGELNDSLAGQVSMLTEEKFQLEEVLQDTLEEKESRIKELVADNNRLIEKVKNKSLAIEKKDGDIDKLAKKIGQMDGEIAALKIRIESLSSDLSSAHRREQDCRRLLESRSARLIDAEEKLARFQEAQRDQLDERGE